MKNQNNRLFWSKLGFELLGTLNDLDTSSLPALMQEALVFPMKPPSESKILIGDGLKGNKARYVYNHSWKILRTLGFSRPARIKVFPGIELFVPFYKGSIVVLPQGFQQRIPLKLRAHALVGKNAALRAVGIHLVIVAAIYDEDTWEVLKQGGCTVCTPDKLRELTQALDFAQGIKQI